MCVGNSGNTKTVVSQKNGEQAISPLLSSHPELRYRPLHPLLPVDRSPKEHHEDDPEDGDHEHHEYDLGIPKIGGDDDECG